MDSGPGVLRQLDREWERIGGSARGRVALRRWAESEPALVDMRSLAEVVERINERGNPKGSDAMLFALVRVAATEDLAARTVLQAMMPSVKNLTVKFCTCGAWCPEETAAVVAAAMWERIRSYPIERRPAKVAANLTLDTRQRVWRTGYKQVHGRLPRSKAA